MRPLVAASHPGPAAAVTLLAVLLAFSEQLSPGRVVLVAAAVLAGHLSIGWCNDIADASRDRAVGRRDKPVASGAIRERWVRLATTTSVLACVVLSLSAGWLAGLVNLVCIAAGWAYNLSLKSTPLSWLPYAVAFGGLPAFVALAGGAAPLAWVCVAGGLLGVGAHVLNVLPDLADDAATGVRGLPHRLGARTSQLTAVALLVVATVVVVVGAATSTWLALLVLAVVAALAAVALTRRGRSAFVAAIGIALVDAALLVGAR